VSAGGNGGDLGEKLGCQIVIAGVGGQGVLFATRVFTEIARQRGLPVIGSENHGMSQRGGSVTSHLKLGEFQSPLVAEGEADILLGLDNLEAHRNLPFLRHATDGRAGGLAVANAPRPGDFPDPRLAEALAAAGIRAHACPADEAAMAMGNPLVANLVLLGFAAALPGFPFPFAQLRDVVDGISPAPHRGPNLQALERGKRFTEEAAAT
jgi:indolepyruvate ferredoxin oxidoreductase beta subunit